MKVTELDAPELLPRAEAVRELHRRMLPTAEEDTGLKGERERIRYLVGRVLRQTRFPGDTA
jgi:hypothetical protein